MEKTMPNVVQIKIYSNPNSPSPTMTLPDVPWYAGITALQAMIIGEAMHSSNFSFRVVYKSIYGAFIDSIDGVTDNDQPNLYWMLTVDGADPGVGASEAVIQEDSAKTSALIEWRYVDVTAVKSKQAQLKAKPL
jgi:hypothetical protein